MKDVNLQTTTVTQSWCKIQPLNGDNHTRAKQKTSQETEKSLRKFLEPSERPKVIFTDTSSEIGNSCEELSRNHCTSTLHGSETNGSALPARGPCNLGSLADFEISDGATWVPHHS